MRWAVAVRALALGLALATLSTTHASASSFRVDVGLFYNDLAPHGRWIENVQYGWVWVPSVSASWRPYAVGHWVWTDDYGWLWVSDEDFGWAVYHYGRWYEDPVYGWAWVPGYQWAPAWVSFRSGGGYMGWAPLPPRVEWAGGFRVGAVEFDTFIEPRSYCFIPERDFVVGSVRGRVVPVARNMTIIHATRNVTRYAVEHDRIVNRSVSLGRVEHAVGRPVPRLRTVAVESPLGLRRERVRGNSVQVFNPGIRRTAEQPPLRGKALERRPAPQDRAVPRSAATPRPEARSSRAWREEPRGRAQQERAQYRQRLEKRQTQEVKEMERVHDREIKHPQQAPSTRGLERRQQAEHQALEQRHSRQRQDFEVSRQQAHQARERRQDQPRAEARPQDRNHSKEQAKPKRKESQRPS